MLERTALNMVGKAARFGRARSAQYFRKHVVHVAKAAAVGVFDGRKAAGRTGTGEVEDIGLEAGSLGVLAGIDVYGHEKVALGTLAKAHPFAQREPFIAVARVFHGIAALGEDIAKALGHVEVHVLLDNAMMHGPGVTPAMPGVDDHGTHGKAELGRKVLGDGLALGGGGPRLLHVLFRGGFSAFGLLGGRLGRNSLFRGRLLRLRLFRRFLLRRSLAHVRLLYRALLRGGPCLLGNAYLLKVGRCGPGVVGFRVLPPDAVQIDASLRRGAQKLVINQRGTEKRIVGKGAVGVGANRLFIGGNGTAGIGRSSRHTGAAFQRHAAPVKRRHAEPPLRVLIVGLAEGIGAGLPFRRAVLPMMQARKLGLGPFVIRRIRGHRRHRRTEQERHDEAEQNREKTAEHTEKIPEVLPIVLYGLPPVNGKKISVTNRHRKKKKFCAKPDFSVDSSAVLLYKRFRSTTRE